MKHIQVSIHKRHKDEFVMEVFDGDSFRYFSVPVTSKHDDRRAMMRAMNKLGEEGWELCSYPYNYSVFHMKKRRD